MRVPWRLFLFHAQPQRGGCTQATNPMQQPKRGATIFLRLVAPTYAFSVIAYFLLLFGAKTAFFRLKRTINNPLLSVGMFAGRVAPFLPKKRVAPGCTRIVLQILLASA
jgi:hypothetical protein